ncbi:MAG: hypothetical protein ACQER3_20120 [Pseudomonadota bacterium]|jgi:hypothetical protein|uniref:hypothetical protein n=1 Tax=Serratia fonticola TaxID=47917 RepID=UPI0014196FDB|nr:hypothetical protein [Serratia fonticola]MBC3250328.1 hypothetical protein [Serratia fonticola]NXZ86467.1 hypothetical protein [Serratia fonticola]
MKINQLNEIPTDSFAIIDSWATLINISREEFVFRRFLVDGTQVGLTLTQWVLW